MFMNRCEAGARDGIEPGCAPRSVERKLSRVGFTGIPPVINLPSRNDSAVIAV
jgi:hypothetical protein